MTTQEATDQHVAASFPDELMSQDLYRVGHVKGVGKIYMPSAVDCATSLGFAKRCLNKLPIHSVALLHERVVPFFDEQGPALKRALTDCGRKHVGRADQHPFELYTGAMDIEHRTTRPARPFTSGFVERDHQTLENEFFAKVFWEKWFASTEELQKDLDAFLETYNKARPHSGYRPKGRTPYPAMLDVVKEQELKSALGTQPEPQQEQPLAA